MAENALNAVCRRSSASFGRTLSYVVDELLEDMDCGEWTTLLEGFLDGSATRGREPGNTLSVRQLDSLVDHVDSLHLELQGVLPACP